MEKQKREVVIENSPSYPAASYRSNSRVLAFVLIGVGIVFLLINAGVFSFDTIGEFFGSVGEFFGNLGGSIGEFFGNLGGSIGEFFGTVGSSLGRFWPVILIVLGLAVLFWRGKPSGSV